MAVKTEKKSAMLLKVETGQTAAGATAYKTRTISNISPALSDDDFLTIGGGISELQAYPLAAVQRRDTATLTEE